LTLRATPDPGAARRRAFTRAGFPALPRRPVRVVLDRVARLPNIGSIFRLCDAMRVERLFVCGVALQPHKRRLVQAARGTMRWVPWEACEEAAEAVARCRADGYAVAALELAETSVPPHELRADRPLCLVLGAERRGVSEAVLAQADQVIAIPMDGMCNSINVSTAAAILLHEAARRFPLPPPPDGG
jgi:tRNA G18 (ribose-2'-O)-methylase SpoU